MNPLTIYLAGEIHSDWRRQFRKHIDSRNIPADCVGPQEVHDRSDSIGEDILGKQPDSRYRDLMGARVNTLRTRVLLKNADVVVAYFGEKFKQWNTAADAGAASALEIPLVLVRDRSLTHALKEIDAMANVTVDNLEQAADAVAYILE